jgi:two-component system sensor histidine kinase KdpD
VTGGPDRHGPRERGRFAGPSWQPAAYAWATVSVAIALGAGQALTALTPFPNLSMVFMLAVLFTALQFGRWPAIYASALSFLTFNFFFIEPRYTLTVAEPHEFLALSIFLIVAVTASALAGRVREQAQIAATRVRATRRLYEFTRRLSGLATLDAVAEGAASEINASLARATVVLLEQDGDLVLTAAWPPEDSLDTASLTAARWAFSHNEPAGADTATLPTVPWLFVPLVTARGPIGVVGIAALRTERPLDSEGKALFDTLAEQTAAALERASLSREMVSTRAAAETERLRNTLLASVSHDFRTPLASILGASTSLIEYGDKLTPEARRDLLGQIKDEAEGLDDMVRNLLAITRIDAGGLELRLDWIDLREIIGRVISRARRHGATQTFTVNVPADLPLIRADATLVEQAISNIVGNAVAHTPGDTQVLVEVAVNPSNLVLTVTDHGAGIPPAMLPHVFDKFVRGRADQSDGGQGTGLGLAIAKGIMEAHQGSIAAESPAGQGRGTRIVMTFPRTDAPT